VSSPNSSLPAAVVNEGTAARGRSGPPILLPLALLVLGTVAIELFDLDRAIARLAHDPQTGWVLRKHAFVTFLYDYATWPAILVACVSGVIWIISRFHKPWRRTYRLAIFVGLTIALGPGLMVNTLLKGYYGRPRPAEMREFGGTKEYAAVWQPRFGSGSRSFPSGHAAMGFFWFSFALYHYERSRRRAAAFALLALLHGGLMGWGRMMQGGHWLSDVLWAAGFVYLAAWILYRTLRLSPAYSAPVPDAHDPTTR